MPPAGFVGFLGLLLSNGFSQHVFKPFCHWLGIVDVAFGQLNAQNMHLAGNVRMLVQNCRLIGEIVVFFPLADAVLVDLGANQHSLWLTDQHPHLDFSFLPFNVVPSMPTLVRSFQEPNTLSFSVLPCLGQCKRLRCHRLFGCWLLLLACCCC